MKIPGFKTLRLFLALLLSAGLAGAAPLPPEAVPDVLKPWVPWVLHGHETLKCPTAYNEAQSRQCVWPSQLGVQASAQGATFRLDVQVFGGPAEVELPGEVEFWPQDVSLVSSLKQPLPVVLKNARPVVVLPPGAHTVTGTVPWTEMPQNLMLPKAAGVVRLTVLGKAVDPLADGEGRVWLREAAAAVAQPSQDALVVRTYRLIQDDIPLRLTTRFDLAVAGSPREIQLPAALLDGFIAEAIHSALPARLEGNMLKLQARAGNWPIEIKGRLMAPATELALPQAGDQSAEEVWSFASRNDLRMVTVEGAVSIDPRQIPLPPSWKVYPAYRLRPGERLKLVETRRGNPQPNPDKLTLNRQIWLDFGGAGYTMHDEIGGTLSRSWRLEMVPPAVLGRASVDAEDQPVTRLQPDGPLGIEVRNGLARINADSRVEGNLRVLPASGWTSDFNQAAATLHLPPGWRLLHAQGVDVAQGSWVEAWNLWDFFFVLLSTLAAFKLSGWRAGVSLGAALVLSWHMPGAPRLMWIAFLALLAATQVLPEGRLRKVALTGKRISLVVILLLLLSYAVEQIRLSLHPTLEQAWLTQGEGQGGAKGRPHAYRMADKSDQEAPPAAPAPAPAAEAVDALRRNEEGKVAASASIQEADEREQSGLEKRKTQSSVGIYSSAGRKVVRDLAEIDPNAKVQTGPGLPNWHWHAHALRWQGPLESAQELSLFLLPPAGTVALRLGSLLLMLAALLTIVSARPKTPQRPERSSGLNLLPGWLRRRFGAAAVLLLALVAYHPGDLVAQTAPPQPPAQPLLDELRDKLTAAPDCQPQCAELAKLAVLADGARVQLRMELHALSSTMVPLPGKSGQWQPAAVLVDGKPATLARGDDGILWLKLDKGVSQVVLDSEVGDSATVQLGLPMAARAVRTQLKGWALAGLDARGLASGALTLSREGSAESTAMPTPTDASNQQTQRDSLAPLVSVARSVHLGARRTLDTRISRIAPSKAPVTVKVRLLEGEAVNDPSVRVEEGYALVQLGSEDSSAFSSTLKDTPTLKLISTKETNQIEVWSLDASTQWHVTLGGIAPVLYQSGARWQPRWQPWPGEEVSITISKPAGEAGQTLTIDSIVTTVTPGQRATDVTAILSLRSGQGGTYNLELPDNVQLLEVAINGQVQPIQPEGRKLRIPLAPGALSVKLNWREARGMDEMFSTAALGLGQAAVNDVLHLNVPRDRVVLAMGGASIGPAVLFWGLLLAVALFAVALGRSPFTPLGVVSWLLLGVGLLQSSVAGVAVVVGWFMALNLRRRAGAPSDFPFKPWVFNTMQIFLAIWTILAISTIFGTVHTGLRGYPELLIQGNGSDAWHLHWYEDRVRDATTSAWVLSVPVLAYRVAMLLWALWLAGALLRWIKWGWECYSTGGYWFRRQKTVVAHAEAVADEEGAAAASDTQEKG
ncbi:MAG: hypothetical protein IPH35_26245 [Rhodoferax sp.]|nr:hypothetical protein [Rhodoferax sp.]